MCKGFGVIVDRELNVWFSEPVNTGDCSHAEILEHLGWEDNADPFLRYFVRVQFPDWTAASFEFDEEDTLPGWAEEHRQEIQKRCTKVLEKLAAAGAEYDKVRASAGAEYDKVRASARAEYEKVLAPARAEYEKVRASAWAEYKKVCAPAGAELTQAFAAIPGYVGG